MPYCTKEDLNDVATQREIIALTAEPGDQEPDETKIDAAIQRAGDKIDNILAKTHTIPLSPVPTLIKSACADMAFYLLLKRPDELRRQRYLDAIKDMQELSKNPELNQPDTAELNLATSTNLEDTTDAVIMTEEVVANW